MPSKPAKKKKTVNYGHESLQLALKEIREGGQGIRRTCQKYGIPRTTIQDRLSGKRRDQITNRGPEPVLGRSGEKQVVQWLINIAKCGFPIKKEELLDTVQKILKDSKKENPFKDDRPGQTWYLNFLKRNPEISRRQAEGINKARARVTEESIRLWFQELETFLAECKQLEVLKQPERIFNCDETGFSLCPKTGKVLGPRGFRNLLQIKSGNEKDNLTVLVTFNACGQICPPLVVFPYIRPPKTVVDSMPPEWCLGRSESGWMRGDVFFEYITNDFHSWIINNNIQKPVIIFLDRHKSHMSMMLSTICEQLQIILYALPPNTTHLLQPADVSVFAPLKCHWKNTVRRFLSNSENINSSVTKTNFCSLLKTIIEDPRMTSDIINGFKKCGLFPLNPNAVDYTKCVQNTMERLNDPRNKDTSINNQDLISTRKVLQCLRPILKKNNIDVTFILKEVKKLRKTESREVLYETASEDRTNSTINHSASLLTENNASLNANPETSKAAFSNTNNDIVSTREIDTGNIGLSDTCDSNPHCRPDEIVLLLPMDIAANAVPSQDIPVEVDVHNTPESLYSNLQFENQNMEMVPKFRTPHTISQKKTDESLSTLHVSGLDDGTLVSLDDIVIIPMQTSTPLRLEADTMTSPPGLPITTYEPRKSSLDTPCVVKVNETIAKLDVHNSASTLTMNAERSERELPENEFPTYTKLNNVNVLDIFTKPTRTEENTITAKEQPISAHQYLPINDSSSTPKLSTTIDIITSPRSPLSLPPKVSSASETITSSSEPITSSVFSKHLFIPQPLEKSKQSTNKPRVPAAISSLAWRTYYEEKEKEKVEKKESAKRKREEISKKKLENQELKKRKLVKFKTVDKLVQNKEVKKNLKNKPLKKRKVIKRKALKELVHNKEIQSTQQNCALCQDILNSDTEEEDDKNVGCDFCTKWFHLKCTNFVGLVYDEVKNKPFKCNTCILGEE